ncbi:MAG: VIT domain-containing protein [Acidobacteriota bacterium]
MNWTRPLIAALIACHFAPSLLAGGLIIIDRPTPVPHRHYPFAPLQVKSHHVDVRIDGQVAVTRVEQVFYNPNPANLEGHYVFPIPRGARIDKFSMEINGRPAQAELLEAAKARKIYEDIVRRMKDPALMEYAGQGLFRVRIFPIEGRRDKRITLSYTEVLENDAGLVGYRYPLNTEKFSSQPIGSLSLKVSVRSQHPIKSIYSPSHRVEIDRRSEREAVAGFEESGTRPGRDFQLFYSVAPRDLIGLSLITHRPDPGQPGFFMLLASPGEYARAGQTVPKDLVFVLDTSGSMAGEKLDQARRALRFCVANLNPGDRFEVIRFSTEAEALFGRLTPFGDDSRRRAFEFIDGLKAIGGTAIHDALVAAVRAAGQRDEARPKSIIFLTDGRPTIGTTDVDQIVSAALGNGSTPAARVFSFGVGTDIHTHLLDKISRQSGAFTQYVLPDEDIEVKVSSFYSRIDHPVLSGLTVAADSGIRLTQMHPSPLPDLYKGGQLVVFGRYQGDGPAELALLGRVAGQSRRFAYRARFARRSESLQHEYIPRLWATRRVGFLLDEIRLRGDSPELRQEIVRLARRYGIVTPYTSYLIVEDEVQRGVPIAMRTQPISRHDPAAIQEYRLNFDRFRNQTSGQRSVDSAQAVQALESAETVADQARVEYLSLRGASERLKKLSAPAGSDAAARPVRYLGGRAFYRNGEVWLDSLLHEHSGDRRVRVRFGSEEYFELAVKGQQVQAILALGTQVHFVLGGTIYEGVEF